MKLMPEWSKGYVRQATALFYQVRAARLIHSETKSEHTEWLAHNASGVCGWLHG